jgi:hypothetical protein
VLFNPQTKQAAESHACCCAPHSVTVSSVTTVSADDMSLHFSGLFGATRHTTKSNQPLISLCLACSICEGFSDHLRGSLFACTASKRFLISIGMASPNWPQDRKAVPTFSASRRWVVEFTSSTSTPMEASSPNLSSSKME